MTAPRPGAQLDLRFIVWHDSQVPGHGRFTCEDVIKGWAVGGTYQLSPHGLTMTSIWLRPRDPAEGLAVTSRLLRTVKVTELLGAIRQRYEWAGQGQASPPEVRTQPARRRSRRDDRGKQAQLRRIAIAYINEQTARGVHKRLAGRFRITADEVKALIRAARHDGWLAEGTRSGSRGAEPGPRLLVDKDFMAARERGAAPAEEEGEKWSRSRR